MSERESWDRYFLTIAHSVATRATCDRLHVGCVLVDPRTKSILATGYNGSVRGMDHCDDVGHDMDHGHCVRTVHAEANAIAQAASRGVAVAGAVVYLTARPCWPCAKLLLNAGVQVIVYAKSYRDDERVTKACEARGVELVNVVFP
jgi:dCMP deaminase